jgi:molybdate-binding protein
MKLLTLSFYCKIISMSDVLGSIHTLEPLEVLSDSTRLALLRYLMGNSATLSQLAQVFGSYPAQIRHHLKKLEGAGLIELVSTKIKRGFVEKYYQATARAYLIQVVILPVSDREEPFLAMTSHDPALELLAKILEQTPGAPHFFPVPVGSLDSLIALRQGICHLAGCHLLDLETGTYNLPFIRHIFPDRAMRVVHLARRLQGLILQPGNPLQIRSIEDLARPDVHLVNRRKGTGTRLWLDQKLLSLGMDGTRMNGYTNEVATHIQVAEAVASGQADVGIGLFASALEQEMGFIPLFEEAYDLVVPESQADLPIYQPIWEILNSAQYRLGVQALGGYYPRRMGEVLVI